MDTNGPESFGERVRRARGEATQPHVLRELAALGFEKQQTWLSRIENDGTKRVDFDELVALGQALGEDPYYLLTGEKRDAEDTPFVRRMRQYGKTLDRRGQFIVESIAAIEIEESRKRAAEVLSEDEALMLAQFRAAGPEGQRLLLAGSAPTTEQPRRGRTSRREDSDRPGRSA